MAGMVKVLGPYETPSARSPERRATRYLREAAGHPVHMLILGAPSLAIIAGAQLFPTLLVTALLDLVALFLVSRVAPFRAWVDRKMLAEEYAVAGRIHTALVAQMMDVHRHEFGELERLADRMQARISPRTPVLGQSDDCFGVNRLLAAYAKNAVAYRAVMELLSTTNKAALGSQIRRLEALRESAPDPRSRAIVEQRLAVANMRVERWQKSADEAAAMEQELAMIADLVRLMHEAASAPASSGALAREVDEALANLRDSQQTLHELSQLVSESRTVDARTLEMGRWTVPVRALPHANDASPVTDYTQPWGGW